MRPVVFDCDGVLVDSEDLAWEAWRRAALPYGVTLGDAEKVAVTGMTDLAAFEYLGHRELPDYETYIGVVNEEIYRLFVDHLQAFEDAVDVLDHLAGRTPLAVASSSPRERLDIALRSTGLSDRFDAVVAGDEVPAAKPAPDLFLAAAVALGVEPGDCVAVEDSPSGIAAARAAGMRVVAVDRAFFPAEALVGADLVVPRLTPAVFLA